MVCFGNCIGPTAYWNSVADKHFANLFILLVGRSARGRKGQSFNVIKDLFKLVDPEWSESRIMKGLSSGEGLIRKLQDETTMDSDSGCEIQIGSNDKRLLCVESEFSSVLKMTRREGNVLSQVIRDAWDSNDLEIATRHDPLKAKNPHFSMVGHITFKELFQYLSPTEIHNGFGNRFIFMKAETSKKLPFAEPIPENLKEYLSNQIRYRLDLAKTRKAMDFSNDAKSHWAEFYNGISDSDDSVVGTLTARQEAQVRRLAMIIALINGKNEIELDSLLYGLDIFEASIRTLEEIYGNSTGNEITDKICVKLSIHPHGLSKTQIHNSFSNNYSKELIDRSLNSLKSKGKAESKFIETGGRPVETWYAKVSN